MVFRSPVLFRRLWRILHSCTTATSIIAIVAMVLSGPLVLYSCLQLIKWKGASDEIILVSLAGCAVYGLLLSLHLQHSGSHSARPNNSTTTTSQPLELAVHRYTDHHITTTTTNDNEDACCVVCWEPYTRHDTISYGPTCRHMFHAACLRKWTVQHGRNDCPCCRCSLVSSPQDQQHHRRFVAFEELFRPR